MTSSLSDLQRDLSPEQVADLVADGKLELVDIRETYEHDAGHIAGDRHVEMDKLPSAAGSFDPDRPPVFYCRSGSRSGTAVELFRGAGIEAFHLDGGILAWVQSGRALEPEAGSVADH
jgi:rhodanese-related sulfurtransferase